MASLLPRLQDCLPGKLLRQNLAPEREPTPDPRVLERLGSRREEKIGWAEARESQRVAERWGCRAGQQIHKLAAMSRCLANLNKLVGRWESPRSRPEHKVFA